MSIILVRVRLERADSTTCTRTVVPTVSCSYSPDTMDRCVPLPLLCVFRTCKLTIIHDGQTDRHDGQTRQKERERPDRHTDRHTDTQIHRHTACTDTQTDTQTDIQTHTHTSKTARLVLVQSYLSCSYSPDTMDRCASAFAVRIPYV